MDIVHTINDSITPKPLFECNHIIIEKKDILEIVVGKGDNGPYYYRNKVYMRNDTSSLPVDGPSTTYCFK